MPPDKHVRFPSNIKGHSSHRSRDSGIGSSNSSQRASLGTAEPTSRYDTEQQSRSVRDLQNALDAANERVASLEAANAEFKELMKARSRDRRKLEQDNEDLSKENQRLRRERDEARSQNQSRRSPPSTASSSPRMPATARPVFEEDISLRRAPSSRNRPTPAEGERRARRRSVNEPRSGYTLSQEQPAYTHAQRPSTTAAFASSIPYMTATPLRAQYSEIPRTTPVDGTYHYQPGLDDP
ncbi:hypothetical protein BP5796_08195 [Coleophoma crateriformis]|uniref:Uncharacterized protein n=1 Tax=Coleophoma crateriformis TaxID=565419 RepID=A0A3D8RE53_9HELO|nr:hypothetical protein BP5796_08195 [Coleophoma crateriformis]